MPAMSRFEAAACRSRPWRVVTGRVVLPWALQGVAPAGHVLEIGAGSGAMAREVLARHPDVTMTVTDVDPGMVDDARARLAAFGDRVDTRRVDATALPFADGTFDAVVSWLMLHHTVGWEKALAEAIRVVRPGGHVVGYDLLSTPPMRALHRSDTGHVRLMRLSELRAAATAMHDVGQAILTPCVGGLVVRFLLHKSAAATAG
jgi:ubiquinone/menaquinone biosynthesis C-methylase UbiE